MGRPRKHKIGVDRRKVWVEEHPEKLKEYEVNDYRRGYKAGYKAGKSGGQIPDLSNRTPEYQAGYKAGHEAGCKASKISTGE